MKRIAILLLCIICSTDLLACQKADETTVIEMEMDQNYDLSDPFVNARLFCVAEDLDALEAEIAFQMDGERGVVEIKDNQTDEVLWSNTWLQSTDGDTVAVTLKGLKKEGEYALWFTGTKIIHAKVTASFAGGLVQEREKPMS